MSTKKESYESLEAKLDEITNKLDAGDLSLDEMMQLYTQGTEIIEKCRKILADYSEKIKTIRADKEDEDINDDEN